TGSAWSAGACLADPGRVRGRRCPRTGRYRRFDQALVANAPPLLVALAKPSSASALPLMSTGACSTLASWLPDPTPALGPVLQLPAPAALAVADAVILLAVAFSTVPLALAALAALATLAAL